MNRVKTDTDCKDKHHHEKIRFVLENRDNLKKSLSINDMFNETGKEKNIKRGIQTTNLETKKFKKMREAISHRTITCQDS